jgi:hypothetical protein
VPDPNGESGAREPLSSSGDAATTTLAYAPAKLFTMQPARVDALELSFSIVQLGLACFALVQRTSHRGHFVLRDPTWWKWLAWQASGGAWMLWAWAGAAVLALIGAAHPPGRRRRWYGAYLTVFLAGTVACLVGLTVLHHVPMQERWVPYDPAAPASAGWQSCHVEANQYLLFPVFFTIANPLVVLFAIRGMRLEPRARGVGD